MSAETGSAKQTTATTGRVTFRDEHPPQADARQEILRGLARPQKTVEPKWFYDEHGSALFDRITRLAEYYPTRTEREILLQNREQISRRCGRGCLFIEPGSGSCEKVRLLLDTLRPAAYVPVDISADFLREAALRLGAEYPWLDIRAICADFNRDWSFLEDLPEGKRVVFYPGSTIGNLEPADAAGFLRRIRAVIGDDGGALVGVDLHKETARLNAAYNDAEGVTAQFNLNLLDRINQLADAEFDRTRFRHHAFYDPERQRIEMHLVSEGEQSVRCGDSVIEFTAGETIHTENSYKYTLDGFARLARKAGLEVEQSWVDDEKLFSVHYLQAA